MWNNLKHIHQNFNNVKKYSCQSHVTVATKIKIVNNRSTCNISKYWGFIIVLGEHFFVVIGE